MKSRTLFRVIFFFRTMMSWVELSSSSERLELTRNITDDHSDQLLIFTLLFDNHGQAPPHTEDNWCKSIQESKEESQVSVEESESNIRFMDLECADVVSVACADKVLNTSQDSEHTTDQTIIQSDLSSEPEEGKNLTKHEYVMYWGMLFSDKDEDMNEVEQDKEHVLFDPFQGIGFNFLFVCLWVVSDLWKDKT